jgi:FkbM family methyltransferase
MKLPSKIVRKIGNFLGYRVIHPDDYSFDLMIKDCLGAIDNDLIIFDVGANEGQSIDRFKKFLPRAHIYAFEPQPDELMSLHSKYDGNETIEVIPMAIGEEEGILSLKVMLKSGVSTFRTYDEKSDYVVAKKSLHKVSAVKELVKVEVNVPVVTLDAFIATRKIKRVDLLKIDTEGFEAEVLRGGLHSLKNNIFRLIEVELTIDERFGSRGNFYDLEQYLVPNGYQIIGFDDLYSRRSRKIFHLNILYAHKSVIIDA